jgi:hypothetical protein
MKHHFNLFAKATWAIVYLDAVKKAKKKNVKLNSEFILTFTVEEHCSTLINYAAINKTIC